MVDVAQLVRASDCGSEGRGFEPHLPPQKQRKVLKIRVIITMITLFCVRICSPLATNIGLLVKIVDKIGAVFTYWSKIVDKYGSFRPFIISI